MPFVIVSKYKVFIINIILRLFWVAIWEWMNSIEFVVGTIKYLNKIVEFLWNLTFCEHKFQHQSSIKKPYFGQNSSKFSLWKISNSKNLHHTLNIPLYAVYYSVVEDKTLFLD